MLKILLSCLSLLLCVNYAQAEIYQSVGPNGSVEFSDAPADADAQPVKLQPLSVSSSPPVSPPNLTLTEALQFNERSQRPGNELAVNITQPKDGETLWNQAEIKVRTQISPALGPGQSVRLLANNKVMQQNTSGEFSLENLDRGEQMLRAEIIDRSGKVLARSKPVKTFIHRTIARPKLVPVQ